MYAVFRRLMMGCCEVQAGVGACQLCVIVMGPTQREKSH
jgi:hypothetical protein